ncbi:hypothetical protein HYDPIDRAFT_176873 [Hydnomerulius pinastri MD-312]|uniref:Ubinuclein middle domain-containing protein n=1 Tax=Hydnomerulius pinastri MD-312 TaxID=994086 RepID=A0A0C9WCL3_9AGAM|nr:hypothetical protein HYDPIDRAFT_176873 [Hydnomerulius pinastri MD-312]
MSDDVEMLDVNHSAHKVSPRSPAEMPPTSRSSHSSSISVRNDIIELSSRDNSVEPTTDHDGRTLASDVDNDVKPPPAKKMRHSSSAAGSKPASTAGAGVKPKSSKPSRPRSPSPTPPPPPPPPFQTLRLDIVLGGPENYEVDITSIAKSSGQRQPTPPPPKADTSESEGEETHDDQAKPKKKKVDIHCQVCSCRANHLQKKHMASEYYDVTDPFIDDSEINIDNRTHFAQTKQQGFYVSSGEVALMKDSRTPKKPKSKKPPATEAGPSKEEDGSKDHPISFLGDEKASKKRKNYTVVEENGKKRKVVDMREFHPELQAAIEELKAAISKESWNVKGKFPAAIKPILADVALKAVNLGEYDDDFFSLMPVLFPYNRFTMTKLIKRTIFTDHFNVLTTRQDELLEQLAALTKDGFPKAQEEWEKSVAAWERRQEKAKAESEAGAASTPSAADPSHHDDAGTASGAEGEGAPGTGKPDGTKDAHPPAQKYRLTEAMKSIVWQLVMLSNECCRLENEKNELEGNNAQVSEQGSRKMLYQKIVAAFPSGWLNSGQISREVSSMKKKYEKEAMDQDG